MATHLKRPSTFAGAASKNRSPRIRFGPVRERLVNPWRTPEPETAQFDQVGVGVAPAEEPESDEAVLPRFPTVRQGYDCVAVDKYFAELEGELAEADRELAEMRGRALVADDVKRELERIGEQTSAVLIAAHDQRDEILRSAQEEAERRVSEAASQAAALTSKAEAQLRELLAQKEAAHHQRDLLLEDVRRVSTALAELADGAISC